MTKQEIFTKAHQIAARKYIAGRPSSDFYSYRRQLGLALRGLYRTQRQESEKGQALFQKLAAARQATHGATERFLSREISAETYAQLQSTLESAKQALSAFLR